MIEATRAQFPKQVVGVMVDVGMNLMPLKVIRRKVWLQAKGPYRLSKDPRPKRHPNN